MKKFVLVMLAVFLCCSLVTAKELKGFGFETLGKDGKFYKLQFDGEEEGGTLIIENEMKFVAKGKKGSKESAGKMSFELFDPYSNMNKEMEEKGIKLKNVKVGVMELEPVPDFDSKFKGTLELNKKMEGISGSLTVFLAIFQSIEE